MRRTTSLAAAISILQAACALYGQDEIAKFDPRMAVEKAVVTNGVKWIDGRFLPGAESALEDAGKGIEGLSSRVTSVQKYLKTYPPSAWPFGGLSVHLGLEI